MKTVCFVEHDAEGLIEASSRAIGFASRLAGGSGVVALGAGRTDKEALAALERQGVARLYTVVDSGYAPLLLARGLAEVASLERAALVTAAATDHGNEVLAHLGAISGSDFVANCTAIEPSPEGLRLRRQRWGGSLVEEAGLRDGGRAILSVATDALAAVTQASETEAPAGSTPGGAVELVELSPKTEEGDRVVAATERHAETSGVSLASAKVVVSGGRGMGNEGAFAALEQLAQLLGGAVGVSRAVTSLGWRPHSEQVGQTGTKVTPDLYLACGISGAIQHLAGCQSAKTMVAINTDAEAPIMSRADYAVIGDVNEIVPALVEAIAARRGGA